MSKHTPGPWEVSDGPSGAHMANRPESVRSRSFDQSDQMGDCRGVIVCSFADAHGDRLHAFAECEANARLIAAAPDLLAKLRDVEEWLGDFCDQGVFDKHPAYKLWLEVQAAIAKAEGR